jgi:glycosyltransferase involved in cell wall biosynthesis
MEPILSVIVPSYNNAPWLGRCLDSILNQSFRELEVVVVDDGSADESPALIREYEAKDSRLRGFLQENAGVTAARLAGVARARGQWVTFVDSDDFIEPDMYARLLANAAEFDADITHCGQKMIYSDGRVDYYYNTGERWQQDRLTGLRELLEEKRIEPGLCNKAFRRELFVGLEEWMDWSIKNNEDLLMNFYLFGRAKQSVFEDFCPYQYLIREGSASRRKLNAHLIHDPIRVKEIILDRCEPELKDDAIRAMAETCLYVYAKLALDSDSGLNAHRKTVEQKILGLKPHLSILPKKNALLVRLVCVSPAAFKLVYRIYAFLLHKS